MSDGVKRFPGYRYGPGYTPPKAGFDETSPNCGVFLKAEDVPDGWVDHPSKLLVNSVPVTKGDEAKGNEAAKGPAPAKGRQTKEQRALEAAAATASEEAKLEPYRLALLAEARTVAPGAPENAAVAELEAFLPPLVVTQLKATHGIGK